MFRVLIVGFGNPLRSDDGVGWHVAQRLSGELARADVLVLARQQLTPEIADFASRVEKVVFVDAAHSGEPGSLLCRRVVPAALPSQYSHELSPATLLTLAERLYGGCPPAYMFTIAGETFATGDAMSPTVCSAIPTLLARIKRFIDGGEEMDGGGIAIE
ncbi:MAG: hydrogenase maturation protease [Terriglobales bacterium]